jgi:hypothetical protein
MKTDNGQLTTDHGMEHNWKRTTDNRTTISGLDLIGFQSSV